MIALTTTSALEIIIPTGVAIAAITTVGIYLSKRKRNGNDKKS